VLVETVIAVDVLMTRLLVAASTQDGTTQAKARKRHSGSVNSNTNVASGAAESILAYCETIVGFCRWWLACAGEVQASAVFNTLGGSLLCGVSTSDWLWTGLNSLGASNASSTAIRTTCSLLQQFVKFFLPAGQGRGGREEVVRVCQYLSGSISDLLTDPFATNEGNGGSSRMCAVLPAATAYITAMTSMLQHNFREESVDAAVQVSVPLIEGLCGIVGEFMVWLFEDKFVGSLV